MNRSRTARSSDCWRTPAKILDIVRRIGPITLDPCPDKNKKNWFAKVNLRDGLLVDWKIEKGLAFVNPPYGSKSITQVVDHLSNQQSRVPNLNIVLLVPATPDTRWFVNAWNCSTAVCLYTGRIRFEGADNYAPFPSAFFYMGMNPGKLFRAFSDHGIVTRTRLGLILEQMRQLEEIDKCLSKIPTGTDRFRQDRKG